MKVFGWSMAFSPTDDKGILTGILSCFNSLVGC